MKGRVLVVGGASGVGLETVQLLSARGDEVFIIDRSPRVALTCLAQCSYLHGDIRDLEFVRRSLLDVAEQGLSGVVVTAALGPHASSPREILETNVCATAFILRESSRFLRNWSSVVLLGSTAGYREPLPAWCDDFAAAALEGRVYPEIDKIVDGLSSSMAYAASKRCLRRITAVFAAELAQRQIRVNCLVLSITRTPMSEHLWSTNKKQLRSYISEIPFAAHNEARTVAAVIGFLLSDDAKMIDGSFIFMDGGWTACRRAYEVGTD